MSPNPVLPPRRTKRGDEDPEEQGPKLPPEPQDVFTRLTPTMDRARGKIAEVGLRPYTVYFLTRRWSGDEVGVGEETVEWEELTPPPRVEVLRLSFVASTGGRLLDGAIRLTKVSRRYRLEHLRGQTIWADDPPVNERWCYGVIPRGQIHAELYRPVGEPILHALGWELILNPLNERIYGPKLDV